MEVKNEFYEMEYVKLMLPSVWWELWRNTHIER